MFNNALMQVLGIDIVSMNKQVVEMTMPVDERTHQPAGFLHGGASVLLAETAASIGGYLNIDPKKQAVFGMEINANHVKSKRDGQVTAKATPIHLGKTSMVWDVRITDEESNLISVSRCTLGLVTRR